MPRGLNDARIFNPRKNPPRIFERRGPDGDLTREKVPSLLHRKMVNPSGHVVFFPLADHTTQRSRRNEQAVRYMDKAELKRFLIYGECPLRNFGYRLLPDSVTSLPDECHPSDFGTGRRYGEHRCCPHVEAMIEIRRSKESRRNAELEERRKSFEQRRREEDRARYEQIQEMLARQSAGVAPPSGPLGDVSVMLSQMKDELREEMRAELRAELRAEIPTAPAEPPAGDDVEEG